MTSQSLSNFIDTYLIDETNKIYRIDNFTITNDGEMLDGSSTHDSLTGSKLGDIIWGNGGNDTLYGGGDQDLLTGGPGDDKLYGGIGDDRLQGWDGADKLYGENGKDALYGGPGNDLLYGGAGNDYLCAGSSDDSLWGGDGVDTFVFRPELSAPKSQSVYKDWQIGIDQLSIDSDLMPNGITKSMIKVEADGDLFIQTAGGHRMVFETLDSGDKTALYDSILLI